MAHGAEGYGDVTGQGTDVGAFGASHLQSQRGRRPVAQTELVDCDWPGRKRNLTTAARNCVCPLASHFQGGIRWWNLKNLSFKFGKRFPQEILRQRRDGPFTNDCALRVVGVGGHT